MNEKEVFQKYIRRTYGDEIKIIDCEDKNHRFDVIAQYRSASITFEYKTRYFITGVNSDYLKLDDILIELVQSLPYIQTTALKEFDTNKLNTAIGWFYKCAADRLLYLRTLDDKPHDLFDLDFKLFKQWLLNKIGDYKIVYSKKTTGTINIAVPVFDIPKTIIFWHGRK
jgi:hypothetical protein